MRAQLVGSDLTFYPETEEQIEDLLRAARVAGSQILQVPLPTQVSLPDPELKPSFYEAPQRKGRISSARPCKAEGCRHTHYSVTGYCKDHRHELLGQNF